VDVAMLDSQLAILEHAVAITTTTGTPPQPTGARHPSITPFETFHAADGLFVIAAGNPIKLSDMGDPKTRPPAPRLDGDRAAILAWLDKDRA